MKVNSPYTVVDLFSGAGGMSYGFHCHDSFRVIAAADAELGKPSMGRGALQCNVTYKENLGITPSAIDLSEVEINILRAELGISPNQKISVLSVCPPCTGFSRANPDNHLSDDHRNNLVRRAAEFAKALDADIVVMENARELIRGNFKEHYEAFTATLRASGYQLYGRNYTLSRFGLPQVRERAIVIACKNHLSIRTLDDLWDGYEVIESETSVRAAFDRISRDATGREDFPSLSDPNVRDRLAAISHDGGSWAELIRHPDGERLMTPAMKRLVARNKLGSHPDVYGRMNWNKPAPTIKRECAHIGNGRYAHPEKNRLCSIREMAILQGFPNDFRFSGKALSNQYRHIGDAVPPLISYQLAHVCDWIFSGNRPRIEDCILASTHLRAESVVESVPTDLLLHA